MHKSVSLLSDNHNTDQVNPLKCSDVRQLHFKVFNGIQV